MAVEIQKHLILLGLGKGANMSLQCPNLRVDNSMGNFPLSVEVKTVDVTSKVAVYYSINIQHRDDLENKPVSQIFGLLTVAKKMCDYPFHEIRRPSFSRMLPCDQSY